MGRKPRPSARPPATCPAQHGSGLINSNLIHPHEPRDGMRDSARPEPPPARLGRHHPPAGARRVFRRVTPAGPPHPERGKSTKVPLILVAKADPGMYEASAPDGQAPSPPLLGFGGSIVVQASGHEIAITGAALALDRWEELHVPAGPSRLAAGIAPGDIRTSGSRPRHAVTSIRRANRTDGPDAANIGPREVHLFSRFFPSIPCYELYKMGPGASARPNTGVVASRSSQPHCGYLLSFETDA